MTLDITSARATETRDPSSARDVRSAHSTATTSISTMRPSPRPSITASPDGTHRARDLHYRGDRRPPRWRKTSCRRRCWTQLRRRLRQRRICEQGMHQLTGTVRRTYEQARRSNNAFHHRYRIAAAGSRHRPCAAPARNPPGGCATARAPSSAPTSFGSEAEQAIGLVRPPEHVGARVELPGAELGGALRARRVALQPRPVGDVGDPAFEDAGLLGMPVFLDEPDSRRSGAGCDSGDGRRCWSAARLLVGAAHPVAVLRMDELVALLLADHAVGAEAHDLQRFRRGAEGLHARCPSARSRPGLRRASAPSGFLERRDAVGHVHDRADHLRRVRASNAGWRRRLRARCAPCRPAGGSR